MPAWMDSTVFLPAAAGGGARCTRGSWAVSWARELTAGGEAWRDCHSPQLPGGGNGGEAQGGPEIHHDAVAAEAIEGGRRVGNEVGADLGRVFRCDPQADIDARGEHERADAGKLLKSLGHGGGQGRHDAGEDHRLHAFAAIPAASSRERNTTRYSSAVFACTVWILHRCTHPPFSCPPKVIWELPTETASSTDGPPLITHAV